jgi:CRISPR-associated protein Cmx8
MAQSRAVRKAEPETVTVTYHLSDLPTAPHKAGLAGLVLQARSMRDRGKPEEAVPSVELIPTSATVRFTKHSVQCLFDDLYDAGVMEVTVKSKWQGQAPIREEDVEELDPATGQLKRSRRFVYETLQPRGHFLHQHLPDPDSPFGWLKLWRSMVWAVPRSIPKTRIPYQQRAAGKPCKEGADAWNHLVKAERARQEGRFYTAEVAGPLWLGAQATNAELVPFEGRAEQNLLLHFWPLTALVFAPRLVRNDGETKFVGYALAIPEVADLEWFCEDYPRMLRDLPPDVRGYRPAAAVIDLPAQAALEFMQNLARLVRRAAEKKRTHDSVSSVEYLHVDKPGKTVKTMAAGRVATRPDVLDRYQAIAGRDGGAPRYGNPLFRSGLLLALLRQREWYECMAPMLAERPWPLFLRSERTPRTLPLFAADAAEKFRTEALSHQQEQEASSMTSAQSAGPAAGPPSPLPLLIHRLVQRYVQRKTEEKSGLRWDSFKDRKTKDEKTGRERVDVPQAYREAREKVAADAFLAMRSRREQDFVDYFTATVCSVGQRLREEEYRTVADALLLRPEEVKTLTLLALSANS